MNTSIKGCQMEQLINETVEIARQHFKGFGFEDQQIEPLLAAGERDLRKELDKLRFLLEKERVDIDSINLSLHGLKGLLLNMGNTTVADKLVELRQAEDDYILAELKSLLAL